MNGTRVVTFIAIAIIIGMLGARLSEKYRPQQADYRYGFVDTNPARRTSQFFDTCSPENMGDCPRNNPYKGYPLP